MRGETTITRTTTFTQAAKPNSPTTSIVPTVSTVVRGGRTRVAHVLLGLLAAGGLVAGLGPTSGQALACQPIDPPLTHAQHVVTHHATPMPHVIVSRETLTGARASGGPVVHHPVIRPAPGQGGDPQP